MEELIHIPYGACIVSACGDVKSKSLFFNNDITESLKNFYTFFNDLSDTDIAYLYFLTIDSYNHITVHPGTHCNIFSSNDKNKLLTSFYAQYGIYAYSITENSPIYSCRIKQLAKDPSAAFSVLQNLFGNAVAPSHITEVLESINEKTPA